MSHRFTDEFTYYTHANESTIKKPCGWPQFNGHIQIHPERLDIPLKRKKPTVWAIWNDLGHEEVSESFFHEVMEYINVCPEHIFLLLTKRPKKLKEQVYHLSFLPFNQTAVDSFECYWRNRLPLKNLWFGVTVCNQAEADEKIPILLQIPAAKRFVSYEPGLGSILIKWWLDGNHESGNRIDWVIAGGETGPGARPMKEEWASFVVSQCKSAGVPVFVKQIHIDDLIGKKWKMRVSKNMDEWPSQLKVRELPNGMNCRR